MKNIFYPIETHQVAAPSRIKGSLVNYFVSLPVFTGIKSQNQKPLDPGFS